MKKSFLALTCALAAFTMSAQNDVIKQAESAMKGKKDYNTVNQIIKPAQTNPETSSNAAVYYIPGKAAFNQYDKMLGLRQLGQLSKDDEVTMALVLTEGFDNFKKALPLDAVTDAKGKVKTKYTKDMQNVLIGHLNDLTVEGATLYNNGKYKDAYKSWMTFVEVEENPSFYGIEADKVYPDTVVADYLKNAGLAAYQDNDMALAAQSYKRAAEKGYAKEDVYKNGLSFAVNAKIPELIYFFASKGNEKFGDKDPFYINNLINYFLTNEKYDEAQQFLQNAINENPNVAQYYVLEGLILDEKKEADQAFELYKKALTLEPQNGLANFQLGRSLYLKADKLDTEFSGAPSAYPAFKEKELVPIYLEAIKYMEDAYKYDETNRHKALTLLEVLYYNTNNQAGMDSVKERKLAD